MICTELIDAMSSGVVIALLYVQNLRPFVSIISEIRSTEFGNSGIILAKFGKISITASIIICHF